MLNRIFSAVALVSLVVGCASMGPDFSMADVDALQPGITSFQDAQNKLGKPNNTSYGPNGEISAMWIRSEATEVRQRRHPISPGSSVATGT